MDTTANYYTGTCHKCLTDNESLVGYTNTKETWFLCHICHSVFDNRTYLLNEFLKEDFGKFPIGYVDRNRIDARRRRAKKESAWESKQALTP